MNRVLAACAALLLAGCIAGIGGDILQVDGPIPGLEPAPDDIETFAVVRLPQDWLLYSQPPEVYGAPVLRASGDTEWDLTGRWTVDPGRAMQMKGNQVWVLMGGIYTWYRLTGTVEPWGRVHVWGQMPNNWVYGGPDTVPEVEPVPGTPWTTVPYSLGHVAESARDATVLQLRACPAPACPVLGRPEAGQLVPVTGRLMDASGREWYRVEYRRQILWVPVDSVRIRISLSGRLRRHGAQAAGYRSCEPVVMFPPPHALCPVGTDGRFLDLFEREYDWLDPVFGRLPVSGTAEPDAPPRRPAPQGQAPAAPDSVESEPVAAILGEFPSDISARRPGRTAGDGRAGRNRHPSRKCVTKLPGSISTDQVR